MMRRRDFIAGLGSAAAWSVVAWAQQGERVRRIGVLTGFGESDMEGQAHLSAFTRGLAELGWAVGPNVRTDIRWASGNANLMRTFAKELVSLKPDVILTDTTVQTAALQRETRTIPIVFTTVANPVEAGFVTSLARPGGNITGFIHLEASMASKWLELLTEIAPGLKRAAFLFNPDTAPGGGSYYLPPFEATARLLKVKPISAPVRSDAEIEKVMISLGHEPGGGLVVVPDGYFTFVHRAPIILLAAQNNVPAVYRATVFVREGGLLSYGPDFADLYRRLCRSHTARRNAGGTTRSAADKI
jgi:putative ABC transport system substrate-binding protein